MRVRIILALVHQFFCRGQTPPSRRNHLPVEIPRTRRERSGCAKAEIVARLKGVVAAKGAIGTHLSLDVHKRQFLPLSLERNARVAMRGCSAAALMTRQSEHTMQVPAGEARPLVA
jgi:hypothetical protein